ncbi:PREDICTED: non-specific [Prunus dulcis]|uniref:Non-specific lipid-transfer protein n=1 Tax=Prunus dulcis TaxID=3755 RepID=A0A5E4EFD5_PRUDU|nr:non-specific lipid-transfer protein Cor a 8-like [Prunus dulcis]VVA14414.1 PREDICTED: non-specific [Prunus dulcis]
MHIESRSSSACVLEGIETRRLQSVPLVLDTEKHNLPLLFFPIKTPHSAPHTSHTNINSTDQSTPSERNTTTIAMASLKVVCALFMCMVVAAPLITEAALTCPQIQAGLAPCLGYLQRGGVPAGGCCPGIKRLVGSATTTADRQNACKCLKTVAGAVKGINTGYAAALPSLCGVKIPYRISASTNCNSVK